MAITNCPECGEMTFDGTTLMGNPHRCAPKFEVLHDDDKGEWDRAQIVFAYDHDDAATKAAQQYDESMGEGPSEHIFYVRREGEAATKKFAVGFEYSIDYHAYEKEAA
jgi:hypothetical protein